MAYCTCGAWSGGSHKSWCKKAELVIQDLRPKPQWRCLRCWNYYEVGSYHHCIPRVRDVHHPERG
jgi:hypothetical protein